jgi:hypothetical protein
MDESDGTGAPDAGDGGGITSFLTGVRGLVATIAALVVAVGGLITALHQVGILGGDGDDGKTTPTTTRQESNLFGPLTRPNGRVYFDGKNMFVTASRPNQPLLHLADREEPLDDVAMTAHVTWVSGARDYGVGFVCRYRNAGNYYLLSVLSGGRYNIVKYQAGQGRSLTRGIQQATAATEDSYDIDARCVGAEPTSLKLSVNRRQWASLTDPAGIDSGNIGVRVGTGESRVTVQFDDFELRHL